MSVKISIVIPCYNSENFIKDTLYSINQQEYENYEIVISDGGSTDDTIKIVKSYNFKNLVIISKPDRGVPHALNRGFDASSGDVLCWLNSDDVYVSRKALNIVSSFYEKNQADFMYGNHMTMNEEGIIKKHLYAYYYLTGFKGRGSNLFTGSLFFSRRAWERFDHFSEKYTLAFEYQLLRFLYGNYTPILINEFLSAFRVFPGGLSSKFNAEMKSQQKEIYADLITANRPSVNFLERIVSQINQKTFFPAVMGFVGQKNKVDKSWIDVLDGCNDL